MKKEVLGIFPTDFLGENTELPGIMEERKAQNFSIS
jgi:hypothetical protein